MATEPLGSVKVEVCTTCAGMWFDEGELGRVLDGDQVEVFGFDQEHRSIVAPSASSQRRCPSCKCVLVRRVYQYTTNIPVDGCEQCGGLFLDDGELAEIEKLDDRATTTQVNAMAALGISELEEGAHQARVRAYFFARSAFLRRRSSQGIVLDKDTELGDYPQP